MTRQTLGDWLTSRTPPPPPALAERLASLLRSDDPVSAAEIPDRCLEAAERLLVDLMESAGASRDAALDLLTADALVTYAFEAASDEPDGLDARARQAMRRIARLVNEAPSA